jgi:NAD(P)-dependent dehydrogenase (short-subunit alcohol dehydrogenase family)
VEPRPPSAQPEGRGCGFPHLRRPRLARAPRRHTSPTATGSRCSCSRAPPCSGRCSSRRALRLSCEPGPGIASRRPRRPRGPSPGGGSSGAILGVVTESHAEPARRTQRSVVVTGASSGIGRACAIRLAGAGWHVLGGVRTTRDAESLREDGIHPLDLDVTDSGRIAAAAEIVGERLDGLVDNAGIAIAAPLELVPLDELRHQLEVNVVGQVAVTQALLPALRRARGRIVLMGSIGGRSALPFLGPYAASKHALEAIADVLRVELRPWSMHVSIVEPASIATPIWQKGAERAEELSSSVAPAATALYADRVAAFRAVALARGRGADPDAVAKAVEHALTASRPRARYLVGRDAHLRSWVERLPTSIRDRVLTRALTR